MTERTTSIQRILVIGAGRGGTAMIDLFLKDPQISIVGIIDVNPTAPGLAIAAVEHSSTRRLRGSAVMARQLWRVRDASLIALAVARPRRIT